MLRFLSFVCELLAGLCALISPVAVFHWLLQILNIAEIAKQVSLLNPFFDPMNAVVELFIKTPPLNYGGQEFSTTQGVLACMMTGAFFLLNACAETLKSGDEQLSVRTQEHRRNKQIRKIRTAELKSQQQTVTRRHVFAYLEYDFSACPAGATIIHEMMSRAGGNPLERQECGLTLEFPSLEGAFSFCSETSQRILRHYATLRPIDPQPPFRLALQALDGDTSKTAAIAETRKLIRYMDKNQIIFSQDVKLLMEASKFQPACSYRSLGLYEMGGMQQELFQLFTGKSAGAL